MVDSEQLGEVFKAGPCGGGKRQDASINEVFLHLSKQQTLAVKNSTFHEWVYKGRKFASLAAAGKP